MAAAGFARLVLRDGFFYSSTGDNDVVEAHVG